MLFLLCEEYNANVASGSGNITYIYDATGVKQKKIVSTGSNTLYAGNFVYEGTSGNESLQFFDHPEGYVEPDGSNYNYVYQYKDHLGNIRLSYQDANNNGSIDASSEIIEEKNYYPFGLSHRGYNGNVSSLGNSVAKKFGYNGIELEEALGLDLYEMDMRQYDPAIARWTSIDPVTHHSMSTYTAFDNNPIYFADPSGADSIYNFETGQYVINGQEVSFDEALDYANSGGNADGSNDNETDPKKKKKKKKSWKNMSSSERLAAAKKMSPGGLMAMGYSITGGGYVAAMDGRDAYNPTETDDAEANSALANIILMGVPITKAMKIIQLGKYSRAAYHDGLNLLKNYGDDLIGKGKSYEEVVKILSPARNMLKATIRKGDSWFGRKIAEVRNLYKYGNKLGPQLDDVIKNYTQNGVTNWKAIYDKIWRTSKTFDKIK